MALDHQGGSSHVTFWTPGGDEGHGSRCKSRKTGLHKAVRGNDRGCERRIEVSDDLRIEEYPFEIRPMTAEEGGGHLITYPDLPGCMSDGETPEEAVVNGRDAVKSYLLTCIKFGDAIPEPGTVGKPAAIWTGLPEPLRVRLLRQVQREQARIEDLLPRAVEQGLAMLESTA
jgi:antitoxin HicB